MEGFNKSNSPVSVSGSSRSLLGDAGGDGGGFRGDWGRDGGGDGGGEFVSLVPMVTLVVGKFYLE